MKADPSIVNFDFAPMTSPAVNELLVMLTEPLLRLVVVESAVKVESVTLDTRPRRSS